jgi:hypothetical protein
MRIVTSGIGAEEMIAVSGIQLLQPGAMVAPTTVPMEPQTGAPDSNHR